MGKPVRDYGALVFPHIPKDGVEGWIAVPDLARLAGISPDQVRRGVRQLRNSNDGEPLVSGPSGYRFTHDVEQVDNFRIRMCRTALGYVRTAWDGAVRPFIDHYVPDVRQARRMTRRFEMVLDDLEDLLDHAA